MKRYINLSENDNIEEVRKVQVDLAIKFREVCEKHDLKYYLMNDALLGAVISNDYRPWDDNLDFAMPREDYMKFLAIGKDVFVDKYCLQTPYNCTDMYFSGATKLRNSETTCISSIDIQSKSNQGIWIDIFPLDYLSDDRSRKKLQISKVSFYQLLLQAKTYPENGNIYEISDWKWSMYCWLASRLNRDFIIEKSKIWKTICKSSNTLVIFSNEGRKKLSSQYLYRYFSESIDITFHNEVFKAPRQYTEVLKSYFGENYLIPPPITQRFSSLYDYFVDTKKSYKEYADEILRDYPKIYSDAFTREKAEKKQIILYGSKRIIEKYIKNCEIQYLPAFAVTDDKKDLGYKFEYFDIEMLSSETILEIEPENREIVVCSSDYLTILKKLSDMNINKCYVYCKNLDLIRPTKSNFLLCLNGFPVVYKKDSDAVKYL